MKYIYIYADTNDGDMVASLNEITDEQIQQYLPLITAIKNNNGNFVTGSDYFDAHELAGNVYESFGQEFIEDFIDAFIPPTDNGIGIHTIDEIKILTVSAILDLL